MITNIDGRLLSQPIWISYQDCIGSEGRLRLDLPGTEASLKAAGVKLREGMMLLLYETGLGGDGDPDEQVLVGTAKYDVGQSRWYAVDLKDDRYITELEPDELSAYLSARNQ